MPTLPDIKEILAGHTGNVAKTLLGCRIVRKDNKLTGYIVETEAYLGLSDPSAHSFHGKITERVKPMYLPPGHAYVYFIYGMYHCLNVVAAEEGVPEAVLIRAVEVPKADNPKVAAGPGKLCKYFRIDKSFSGIDLTAKTSPLQISVDKNYFQLRAAYKIAKGPRIGLSHKEASKWPLRFYFKGHPSVSR